MNILIIENGCQDLIKSRVNLGDYLKQHGNEIIYACPDPPKGSEIFNLRIPRNRFLLISFISALIKLISIQKKGKTDITISFRLTPNIINYFSSYFLKQEKRIAVITGLGYAFVYDSWKYQLLRFIITKFYQIAEKRLTIVTQNKEDCIDLKLNQAIIIPGSGVTVSKTVDRRIKKSTDPTRLLYVGRLLKSKGIETAVQTFKLIRKKDKKAVLTIVGFIDLHNPDSISNELLTQIKSIEGVEYLGYVDNVSELYQKNHILLFPSSYREGVPRVIIEALSHGLTIITTNTPGCNSTVQNNGILLDHDYARKASAYILSLTNKSWMRNSEESLKLFNNKFSSEKIYNQYLRILSAKTLKNI